MTRVLIVDDKPENVYLLRALLQGHRCEVDEARHGAEALVIARQTPPDLIISDLLMPVMDGYTLLRHWKADDRLKAIPFVVHTATYTDPRDEKLALDLGADAFIIKPAEPEPFMARIQEVLAKQQTGEFAEAQQLVGGEKVLLEEYSETLIRKLEEKARHLEQANRELAAGSAARKRAEEQLREREHQLSALIRNLPGAVFRVRNDPNYSVEYISDPIAELTGYPADDFRENRRNFGELMHRDDREWVWNEIQRALGEHRRYELTYRFIDAHGRERWNWERGTGIYDAHGELQAVQGFVQDITERKQAEAALRASEARYQNLAEGLQQLVYEADPETFAASYVNPFVQELYGNTPSEWLADPALWEKSIHPDDKERVFREFSASKARGGSGMIQYRIRRKDGSVRWVEDHVSWGSDDRGQVVSMRGVMCDITERKRAEVALRAATHQLQAAQHEERRRIARDLHDSTAQKLAAATMNLGMLETALAAAPPAQHKVFDDSLRLVEEAAQELRTLSHLLHPPLLDELGLSAALRAYVEGFSQRSQIQTAFQGPDEMPPLGNEVKVTLFLAAQEALANVHRHSGSQTAGVRLVCAADHLTLEVRDQGRGAAPERLKGTTGVGLVSLRGRLQLLGGELKIDSGPDGTTLTAVVPLKESNA